MNQDDNINLDGNNSISVDEGHNFKLNKPKIKNKSRNEEKDIKVLNKKRERNLEDLENYIESNNRKIIFCPDKEKLKNFLKQCELYEIKDNNFMGKEIIPLKINLEDPKIDLILVQKIHNKN